MTQNPRRKKNKPEYSKGELNRMIDGLLHPLFRHSSVSIIVDTLLHGMVEQNPPETVKKFVRYSLPKIIKEITKNE